MKKRLTRKKLRKILMSEAKSLLEQKNSRFTSNDIPYSPRDIDKSDSKKIDAAYSNIVDALDSIRFNPNPEIATLGEEIKLILSAALTILPRPNDIVYIYDNGDQIAAAGKRIQAALDKLNS